MLSARSYRFDEREYAGLVTFASMEEIPSSFERLAAARFHQEGISRQFRERFDSIRILERAEVLQDFNRSYKRHRYAANDDQVGGYRAERAAAG